MRKRLNGSSVLKKERYQCAKKPLDLFSQVNGQWKGHSAGGCGNFRETSKNNPIYQFQLDKTGPLLIELRGPRLVQN